MIGRTARLLVGVAALGATLAGCSSSGSAPAASSTRPSTSPLPTTAVTTPAADPAQHYLDAVNAQCDALLPKIIKVTHGGSIDVPVREYLATWPAHQKLLASFDAHVAAITVPGAAHDQAAALAAYVRFADRLDAARLAAAHRGQAAYSKEVKAEASVENDPIIAGLSNAGFNTSCTAR